MHTNGVLAKLRYFDRPVWQYLLAIGAVGLAIILTQQAQPLIEGNQMLLCLVAVTISAWYGGIGPGLVATFTAIVTTDLVFGADLESDLLLTRLRPGLFAGVAVLISALSQSKRTAESRLSDALSTLEQRVEERTHELRDANSQLEAQISVRREAEERYRELFENATDMVYTLDLQGRFTSLNKVGERLIGYTAEQATNLRLADVVNDSDTADVTAALDALLGGEARGVSRLELVSRTGARVPVETTARLIFREGSPIGTQGIARDLTEREALEAERRQSHKLEAIGRLAGGVAHDFNNILMVIQGYLELWLGQLVSSEPLHQDLEEVHKAALRGSALTRQLLAFGRKQLLRVSPLDLNEVVSNISQMLARAIGENLTLDVRLGAERCPIEADSAQLEQVLVNLAVNARDAMQSGGTLTIAVSRVELSRTHGVQPGRYVRLTVTDTGSGMDEATRTRLFEPFFTTKPQGKGSGLGLATVYGIVTQLRGEISVESEMSRGTTFTMDFPETTKALPVAAGPAPDQPLPRGQETILLVEDDAAVRDVTRAVLERHGYRVLAADGPKAALEIERDYQRAFDLVLSDVIMPSMTGPEMMELLKARRPDQAVLYLSGYATDALLSDGVLPAGVDLLQKPIAASDLIREVRRVLDAVPVWQPRSAPANCG